MDNSDEFLAEVDRLTGGRQLTPVDQAAVETVAGLRMRVAEARRVIDLEGITVGDQNGVPKEHPAVGVEKKASQELRGWVTDRPDLFGQSKVSTPVRRKFEMKVV